MPSNARPLAHPLWWCALGLLLLNDHVLKGAGVLPGWFTGKASDLAGLIVAPVLLCAMVGPRGAGGRAACFAVIVAPFATINLFPGAARAAEAVTAGLGVPWRVWCDPTDLVAFAVLPFAWHLLDASASLRVRPALARLAVVAGAFACMATSRVGESGFETSAFLVNRTSDRLEVRVRWVDAGLDCDLVPEHLGRALGRSVFGDGATFELGRGEVLPLDRVATGEDAPTLESDGGTTSRSQGPCDAALIQVDGLDDTIVWWSGPAQFVPEDLGREDAETLQGRVDLRSAEGGRLWLDAVDPVRLASVADRVDPSGCDAEAGRSYEWSGAPANGIHHLQAVERLPGGCLALDLVPVETFPDPGSDAGVGSTDARSAQTDAGIEPLDTAPAPLDAGPGIGLPDDAFGLPPPSARTMLLCVPEWAFPFVPGEVVSLRESGRFALVVADPTEFSAPADAESGFGADGGVASNAGSPARRLWVYSATTSDAMIGPNERGLIQPLDCDGDRTACGAYAIPAALWVGSQVIQPGEQGELIRDDARVLVSIGRAEQVLVAPRGCEPARSDVDLRADVLVLEQREE